MQRELIQSIIDLLNTNKEDVTFKIGFTQLNADRTFSFITNPNYYTTKTTQYVPVMIDFQTTALNFKEKDVYDWGVVLTLALSGDDENSSELIAQKNAVEEFRKYISFNPISVLKVNDTAYQLYNDTDNTGKVPLAWEANTEYTVLYNIPSFTDDLGYTVVSGIEIDALSVTIAAETTGTGAVKFTTGSDPLTDHKQFVTSGGLVGNVKIRTAILEGDFESLDSETIKNIVEDKDESGLYTNLVDNSNEFENWTTQDFILEYTTFDYDLVMSASFLSIENSLTSLNGEIRMPVTMTVHVKSGFRLTYGNNEIFELQKTPDFTFTQLDIITKESGTAVEYNTSQQSNEEVALGVPNRAIWQSKLTISYDNESSLHQVLYDICNDNTTFEDIFELRITKPNGDTIPKDINIQGSIMASHNDDIKLSLVFTESV